MLFLAFTTNLQFFKLLIKKSNKKIKNLISLKIKLNLSKKANLKLKNPKKLKKLL